MNSFILNFYKVYKNKYNKKVYELKIFAFFNCYRTCIFCTFPLHFIFYSTLASFMDGIQDFLNKPYFVIFPWLAQNYPMSNQMSIYSIRKVHCLMIFLRKMDVLNIMKNLLNASSADILFSGSNCSIWVIKSDNYGVIWGNNFSHFCLVRFGKDFIYLIAS